MFHATPIGRVVPASLPLQADIVQQDALLASSLWVNVALAGVTALLFVYMGRNVQEERARMIWAVTLFIPLVSISSYLGLLSGVTIGVIEMPPGHPLDEAVSQWGRYLTWYSVLDIFAKDVFAFLLLNWVASNQDTVASTGSVAGAGAFADD